MQKARKNNGFTLAEVLIVVGILVILMAVAFISVISYLRSMTKLEYDNYAKEIFIAAQNHLSVAESQGYLGRDGFGSNADESESGVYYFVVNVTGEGTGGTSVADSSTVLDLMLPRASLDETIRLGGKYIVRYHKDAGQVLDVFYWSDSGRYSHNYASSDYSLFLAKRGEENKDLLKTYETDNSVIGWYGSAAALTVPIVTLNAPLLDVVNGDQLYVTVRDTNTIPADQYTLKLVITGLSSGAVTEIPLINSVHARVSSSLGTGVYTVVLDDVTASELRFKELDSSFIPGEDIRIQAVAEGKGVVAVPKYAVGSGSQEGRVTNSLFGWGSEALEADGKAMISSIRHLENLDPLVSKVNVNGVSGATPVKFSRAEQTTDLAWGGFFSDAKSIYYNDDTPTSAGYFKPVTPGYALDYDGQGFSISDLRISATGSAGLFGELVNKSSVSDLELLDLSVSSKNANAGALAGTVTGTTVTNVLARSTAGSRTAAVSGGSSTGGLIGTVIDSTVEKCAASLVVSSIASGGSTGGLIGAVADAGTGTTQVRGCYSAGRTVRGRYDTYDTEEEDPRAINVAGIGSVGGLIGSFVGAAGSIENCYSTCSVSGLVAGGLVGTANCTIQNSYTTGLVSGVTKGGAFAGQLTGSPTVSSCHYYEIINELPQTNGKYKYLGPVEGDWYPGISSMDFTPAKYLDVFGAHALWTEAEAYDSSLVLYYSGKYPLPGVSRLGVSLGADDFAAVHYGDWPAPEIWVVNR